MSFIAGVKYFLFSDIRTTIISLIIAFVVYKLAKFYYKVYTLPPGPIPLPFLGNVLFFRGTKEHWTVELERLLQKYGPVSTFWFGPEPSIFITDLELGRELFRKNDFAGRPQMLFTQYVSNETHSDVVLADYGHRWEALRRVAHSAVQKYATTDKLVYLASDCVDQTIKLINEREGFGKPFVPFEYIYHLFLNILATSAFAKSYDINDKEYKEFKYLMQDFNRESGTAATLIQILPVLRLVLVKYVNKQRIIIESVIDLLKNKFFSHYSDYDESVIRDFCDTLITAKNDALREGKESAPYLTDENLTMVLFDLFLAGTDTSQTTFRWLLYFAVYYPELQQKLRQEIESEIGDRIPTHEDRNRCHYVMAYISETLRFRNIVPAGFFHSAVVDTKIGAYNVPKGTSVLLFQGRILKDEKYWSNPDQFIPERFLEDRKFITTRSPAFIPFGVGRRVCLGEKLAIADLFLVWVRFLQSTSDYDIVLHSSDGIGIDPNVMESPNPKEFKISFNKIH